MIGTPCPIMRARLAEQHERLNGLRNMRRQSMRHAMPDPRATFAAIDEARRKAGKPNS